MVVTENILTSLGVTDKPILYVFNKADKCTSERLYDLRFFNSQRGRVVNVSLKEKTGCDELVMQLEALCRFGKTRLHFTFPYTKQSELNSFYQVSEILETEYTDEGTRIYAWVDEKTKNKFSAYLE